MKERLTAFFVSFLLSLPVLAQVPGAGICGAREIDSETSALLESLLADFRNGFQAGKADTVRIPVVFHMVTNGRVGDYPNRVLRKAIDNLNAGFKGTPFRFELARVRRFNNPQWHAECSFDTPNHLAMTRRLAVNPAKNLNVYVCTPGLVTGMSSFPFEFTQGDKRNSIVLHHRALPHGQASVEFSSRGLVLIHEVGHYLGLFHTFSGGCQDLDEVADTPAQAGPTDGCFGFRDTCPAPGADDLNNYMDYANDLCWNHFSPGQIRRMTEMTALFRPALGK